MCVGSDFENSPSWHIKQALRKSVFQVETKLSLCFWTVTMKYFHSFSQQYHFWPVSGTSRFASFSVNGRISKPYYHAYGPTFLKCFSQIDLFGIVRVLSSVKGRYLFSCASQVCDGVCRIVNSLGKFLLAEYPALFLISLVELVVSVSLVI